MTFKNPIILGVLVTTLLAINSCDSHPGLDSLSAHGPLPAGALPDCAGCHSIALGSRRAVLGTNGDFAQNPGISSHHVSGTADPTADPTAAQCLVCHDIAQHGSGTVRLKNADTGAIIAYTSSANVETFCLSCHDADSANTSPFSDGRTLGATYPVDTATRPPTSNEIVTIGWTTQDNAHADDGLYATAIPGRNETIESRWGNFGFDGVLPSRIERGHFNSVRIIVQYHVDTKDSIAQLNAQATVRGIDCPPTPRYHSAEPLADAAITFDVTSCRNWTVTDLLDANFKIKLGASRGDSPTPVTFSLDFVQVEATYNGTGFKMSTEISTHWNKTYGHRQKGLTCIGNGNPNTGCHLNGHGTGNVGLLARNLTLPNPKTNWYNTFDEQDYDLCFTCHASYNRVTKEAILGMRTGGNYQLDLFNNWGAQPAYAIANIQTLFRDVNLDGTTGKTYDDWAFFTSPHENLHMYHLQTGDGTLGWAYRDAMYSSVHCLSCHNVHGSNTQWGWVHDSLQFNHYAGAGSDQYGMIGAALNTLGNYPTSCTFNCHFYLDTTYSWFEPSGECEGLPCASCNSAGCIP